MNAVALVGHNTVGAYWKCVLGWVFRNDLQNQMIRRMQRSLTLLQHYKSKARHLSAGGGLYQGYNCSSSHNMANGAAVVHVTQVVD